MRWSRYSNYLTLHQCKGESFSLAVCHSSCCPYTHGSNVVSVLIPTVLPLPLSPSPRYYRHFCPHYCSFTMATTVLPLSPSPCSSLLRGVEYCTTTRGVESDWGQSTPESGFWPGVRVSHLKETPTPGPIYLIWTFV